MKNIEIEPIYEWLKEKVEVSSGISVFTTQTGSGKSFNIARVLAESIGIRDFRKVFIISPQIKLLNDLREEILNQERKLYGTNKENTVLIVESSDKLWYKAFANSNFEDAFLETFEKKREQKVQNSSSLYGIYEKIIYSFKKLKQRYDSYRSFTDKIALVNITEDKTIQEEKSILRHNLKKIVYHSFSDKEHKLPLDERYELALKRFPFLTCIFPEIQFHRYRFIGMTASKLHQSITSDLVQRLTIPYWQHIPKGSLVIFDESDQCKLAGLNSFIDSVFSRYKNIDKWALCNKLLSGYGKLQNCFTEESEEIHVPMRDNILKRWKSICSRFISKIQIQETLSGIYLPNFHSGYGVIYHDRDSMAVNTNGMMFIQHNKNNKIDYLIEKTFAECKEDLHQPVAKDSPLMITYVDQAINFFLNEFVNVIDESIEEYEVNEREIIKERTKKWSALVNKDIYGFIPDRDIIFQRLLSYIGVKSKDEVNFLRLFRGSTFFKNVKKYTKESNETSSIYNRGIVLSEVRTILGDVRQCELNTAILKNFPESVLLELVKDKDCHIILSSATADIKDPLHNYDFDYLEGEGVTPDFMSKQDLNNIRSYMSNWTSNPSLDTTIYPSKFDKDERNLQEELKLVLGNGKDLQEVLNYLADNEYMTAPFINLLHFYVDFLKCPDAHGGLYVTPYSWASKMKSRPQDKRFNRLLNILSQVKKHTFSRKDYNIEPDEGTSMVYSDLNVAFLSGESFEKDKNYVCELLSADNDAKMLCFICFNSGSVGVNYEYDLQESNESFVYAKSQRDKQKVNFDSVYIEHPTNYIGCNAEDPMTYLRSCIDISLLEENGQIPVSTKKQFIIELLRYRAFLDSSSFTNSNCDPAIYVRKYCYQTKAYREYCMSQVLQALGRLTRTPISRKSVRIAMDDYIARILLCCRMPLASTPLYEKILMQLQDNNLLFIDTSQIEAKDKQQKIKIDFERANSDCNKMITRMVYGSNAIYNEFDDSKDEILANRQHLDLWNSHVLKHPTCDDISSLEKPLQQFYCRSDRYLGDYTHPFDCVYLENMFQCDCIKRYFKNHSFEITKKSDKYVLYPQVIQQLYVGRVGEHIFRALMENLGFTVEELPKEKYEAADWLVNGEWYVDVKFWAPTEWEKLSNAHSWEKKIERCGGHYLIINVPDYLKGNNRGCYTTQNGLNLYSINGLVSIEDGRLNKSNIEFLTQMFR